jgi:hypothetical protein
MECLKVSTFWLNLGEQQGRRAFLSKDLVAPRAQEAPGPSITNSLSQGEVYIWPMAER